MKSTHISIVSTTWATCILAFVLYFMYTK